MGNDHGRMQQMTIDRRAGRATVMFRDALYDSDLLTAFMEHTGRWRHVLAEIHHRAFGYRSTDTQPECWDDDCVITAAFLSHRRIWSGVMTQLLLRLTPPLGAAFLDHRRDWLGVMTELLRYPVTPSHDHMSPLQRRRRRTLAPLRLRCNIRRHVPSRRVRCNLLVAFNSVN